MAVFGILKRCGKVFTQVVITRDQREFYQLITYKDDVDLKAKLAEWEQFYNYVRPHSAMGGKTPYERLIEKMR